MPLWLLILGGVAIYLWAKSQSNQTPAAQLPPSPLPSPTPSTVDITSSSWADDIPTPQSSVPPPMQTGQTVQLPDGTKLFSDDKLTQAAGSSTGMQSVTVTATSVGADGSISGSYVAPDGKTYWFAQPGT